MTPEAVTLDIVDTGGRTVPASVVLYPGLPARVTLASAVATLDVSDGDLLDCLVTIRLALEADGRNLCCQGARPEVWPSGMLRDFSNGRRGYDRRGAVPGELSAEVDLFAPADASEIGTVAEQREALVRFFRSRGVDLG